MARYYVESKTVWQVGVQLSYMFGFRDQQNQVTVEWNLEYDVLQF